MTDTEKSVKTKRTVKRVWDGSKLVVAIVSLTAAINGYMELSKKSVQLSEQNALLFKALSTKVNGMAEKLAYMEGRMDGLTPKAAKEAVKEKIIERPVRAPASFEDGASDSDGIPETAAGIPEAAATPRATGRSPAAQVADAPDGSRSRTLPLPSDTARESAA